MDLISEVIQSAGEVEMSNFIAKMDALSVDVDNLKGQIAKSFKKKYVERYPLSLSFNRDQISNLKYSVENFQNDWVNQIDKSIEQKPLEISDSSDKISCLLQVIHTLDSCIELDTLINSAYKSKSQHKLMEAAFDVWKANDLICKLSPVKEYLKIVDGMIKKIEYLKIEIITECQQIWEDLVSWEEVTINKKGKCITLSVSTSVNDLERIYSIMSLFNEVIPPEVNRFAIFFMKEIIKPLVMYPSTMNSMLLSNCRILTVDYKIKVGKVPSSNDFSAVAGNIITLFDFLKETLNIKSNSGTAFLSSVGSIISEEFQSLLIAEQIMELIPLKYELFDSYTPHSMLIKELQRRLKESGFLNQDDDTLDEYYKDLQSLFLQKQRVLYMRKANILMKKDLHEMDSVGPLEFFGSNENELDDSFFMVNFEDKNLYTFPKCQISKWMFDLVKLIEDCLDEPVSADQVRTSDLIDSARLIIVIFHDQVSRHHRNLLNSIPQQSGLLYNNAMYLSYSILKLVVKRNENWSTHYSCLLNQIPSLQSMAREELNNQLTIQVDILKTTLNNSGLSQLNDMEIFNKSIENCIRQCVRQLMVIHNVWSNVLPVKVYNQAVGLLCDSFIENLINLILQADDIREDITNQLVSTINIIIEKTPQLFQEPNKIHRHVTWWMKLNELKRILAGSMADVLNRWADGKGPLAMEFPANQVHHLIKALFCSSDRRDHVLAQIK